MATEAKRVTIYPNPDLHKTLRLKSVETSRSVLKNFASVPQNDLKKIMSRIKNLGGSPRPAGCEKLTGQERYHLRQGRYRILYSIHDDELTIRIVKVGHRKDVYR